MRSLRTDLIWYTVHPESTGAECAPLRHLSPGLVCKVHSRGLSRQLSTDRRVLWWFAACAPGLASRRVLDRFLLVFPRGVLE